MGSKVLNNFVVVGGGGEELNILNKNLASNFQTGFQKEKDKV